MIILNTESSFSFFILKKCDVFQKIYFVYIQTVAWTIVCFQIIVSGLCALSSSYMISFVPLCMGRKELYYSYDYFYPGGFSTVTEFCKYDNVFMFVPCIIMQFINWLIYCNLIDLILLIKIAWMVKSQTNAAQELLSPNSLTQRKR